MSNNKAKNIKSVAASSVLPKVTNNNNSKPTSTAVKNNSNIKSPPKANGNVSKLPAIGPKSSIDDTTNNSKKDQLDVSEKNEKIDTSISIINLNSTNSTTEIIATVLVQVQETSTPLSIIDRAVNIEEPISQPQIPQNGNVKLIYEQYDEEFPIINGSTTSANIDDVYCLSFVMPGCLIHLSIHSPPILRKLQEEGDIDIYIEENPKGTYLNLMVDQTYYVYVEQEAQQLARDQEKMRRLAAQSKNENKGSAIVREDGRNMESCSCIYGNPCVDEYGCKDWDNRYAIATKNGWKGF
eukprot:gene7177-9787_t